MLAGYQTNAGNNYIKTELLRLVNVNAEVSNMDFKDFVKLLKQKQKETSSFAQNKYMSKTRQSRPRVKKNILKDGL